MEIATAYTLFHKVKFGLQKAFCVGYQMTTSSKSVSSIQMGKRFEIGQGTACYFMQKVRKTMQSRHKYRLSEFVHVDEFTWEENNKANKEELMIRKRKRQ